MKSCNPLEAIFWSSGQCLVTASLVLSISCVQGQSLPTTKRPDGNGACAALAARRKT